MYIHKNATLKGDNISPKLFAAALEFIFKNTMAQHGYQHRWKKKTKSPKIRRKSRIKNIFGSNINIVKFVNSNPYGLDVIFVSKTY